MSRPATRCFVLVLGVILFILVGCQGTAMIPEGLEIQRVRDERLVGLNNRRLIIPEAGNCTLDQLEAREEGLRFAGGVGGLAVSFPESPARPVAHPSWVADTLSQILGIVLPVRPVGVIVLDDFKGGAYTLGNSLYALRYDDLPGDTADEKTAAFKALLDELTAAGRLSHGALVMEALTGFIYHQRGLRPVRVQPDRVIFSRRIGIRRPLITVQAVDTQNFNTQIIADNLVAAMQAMTAGPFPIRRFVVNMSFSIVPCSVLEDYRQSAIPSYQEYIEALAQHNDLVGFEQQLLGLTLTPLPNDPLETLFLSPTILPAQVGADNVTLVASSGNYELPYALSPARLQNVIAVGSQDVLTGDISGFTNSAQVMAPGAWLTLADDMNRNGVGTDARAVVKAGTSFAGPAVAAFLAVDLSRPLSKCSMNVTSSLTQVPDDSNTPLGLAAEMFCP
jgi:hypothetical protein